jgi:predicted MFS family arabinose efflux permease
MTINYMPYAGGHSYQLSLPQPCEGDAPGEIPLEGEIRRQPVFLRYLTVAGLWNFSVFTAGPFFNVHLAQNLGASARTTGLLAMVSALTSMAGQWAFGRWSDRLGAPRVMAWAGMLIPFLPWAWLLMRSPWHVIPINAAAGFLWAGFELCSLNTLLLFSPAETLPRYAALYHLVVGGASALGAAVGGWIAAAWGFEPLFVLSGLGRMAAMGLYGWRVFPRLVSNARAT